MKLKYATVILLLLNATVLAWQWDAFARWGFGPNLHREPERLQQQIRPEALTFETVPARSSASAAAPEVAAPDASAALAPASDAASAASPALTPASGSSAAAEAAAGKAPPR